MRTNSPRHISSRKNPMTTRTHQDTLPTACRQPRRHTPPRHKNICNKLPIKLPKTTSPPLSFPKHILSCFNKPITQTTRNQKQATPRSNHCNRIHIKAKHTKPSKSSFSQTRATTSKRLKKHFPRRPLPHHPRILKSLLNLPNILKQKRPQNQSINRAKPPRPPPMNHMDRSPSPLFLPSLSNSLAKQIRRNAVKQHINHQFFSHERY
ncbi:hypothetical protein TCARB_0937 [Thermofilum adornatum 1505]|uniref:Uncharacterized protein n=1 Tax=Thermofilum adornatum 1505 TaxID=697581 RepID=A0A3G1A8W6_9CREN|nr:hypothetical protein TCARB_0937 [Thermofilum adornatum 1505]